MKRNEFDIDLSVELEPVEPEHKEMLSIIEEIEKNVRKADKLLKQKRDEVKKIERAKKG